MTWLNLSNFWKIKLRYLLSVPNHQARKVINKNIALSQTFMPNPKQHYCPIKNVTTSFPHLPADRQFQKWLTKRQHTPHCKVRNCNQLVTDASKNLLFVTRFSILRLAGNWLSVPCQRFELMLKELILYFSIDFQKKLIPCLFKMFNLRRKNLQQKRRWDSC